jgi:hypothetical protein
MNPQNPCPRCGRSGFDTPLIKFKHTLISPCFSKQLAADAKSEMTAKALIPLCPQKRTSSIGAPHETSKLVDVARRLDDLLRATALPEIAIPLPFRCAPTGTVHPANAITTDRRRSAGQTRAL